MMKVLLVLNVALNIVLLGQCKLLTEDLPNWLEALESENGNSVQRDFLMAEYNKLLLQQRLLPKQEPKDIMSQVSFKLYTKSTLNTPSYLDPIKCSIATSPYDASKKTKFMTHGFWSSADSDTSQAIKNAYLAFQDVNVILVDWKETAGTINYISAAMNTDSIGRYVGSMLDALVDFGTNPKDIHLVGHSLGAHISGFAGKYTQHKVDRITGLDPAGPLFETFPLIKDHLSVGKADFVDIIHTSAGSLGFKSPIGNVDFYPNEGKAPQPGCKDMIYMLGNIATMADGCSHGRSWQLFADSINPDQKYIAHHCDSYQALENRSCNGDEELMGEYVSYNGNGSYYLATNSHPPYPITSF